MTRLPWYRTRRRSVLNDGDRGQNPDQSGCPRGTIMDGAVAFLGTLLNTHPESAGGEPSTNCVRIRVEAQAGQKWRHGRARPFEAEGGSSGPDQTGPLLPAFHRRNQGGEEGV